MSFKLNANGDGIDFKELAKFKGEANILIKGSPDAQVAIMRAVQDSPFMPLTDGAGDPVTFTPDIDTGVIFNASITNNSNLTRYMIKAISGECECFVGMNY